MNITSLAVTLGQAGATILGGALAGPAGAALAPKIIGMLADAFGVEETPEAVEKAVTQNPEAGLIVKQVEAARGAEISAELARLLGAEQDRLDAAQEAEIAKGFTTWQLQRALIQAVIWGVWGLIALAALFGGNAGVRPLMPLGELVSAWLSVTTIWMIVFHGGHTVKEVIGPGALAALFSKGRGK